MLILFAHITLFTYKVVIIGSVPLRNDFATRKGCCFFLSAAILVNSSVDLATEIPTLIKKRLAAEIPRVTALY